MLNKNKHFGGYVKIKYVLIKKIQYTILINAKSNI